MTGTVSGRLRSSAPHMRNVRDGVLKAQVTPLFDSECQIRRDKITNHLRVREIQYRTISDSYLTSKAV